MGRNLALIQEARQVIPNLIQVGTREKSSILAADPGAPPDPGGLDGYGEKGRKQLSSKRHESGAVFCEPSNHLDHLDHLDQKKKDEENHGFG
jgi:hypothetical protein